MEQIKQAIDNHIEKPEKTIKGLKNFKANTTTINQALSKQFKNDIKSKNFIYIIKTKLRDREEILRQFKLFIGKDDNKKKYKLSSLNNPEKFNGVLYVGSSASLNSRINQHLGHNGKRVYSLQLNQWFNKITEVEIKITPIDNSDILYPLENALWDYYEPLFGKKGTNFNAAKHT